MESGQEKGDRKKRAIVIFQSRYGNTEKIALSIQKGLNDSGIEVLCMNEAEVPIESLKNYDLIVIGGPTEAFSASKETKDFLTKIKVLDLHGQLGFAFDTKFDSPFSGSAAKTIEKQENHIGLHLIFPHASAYILGGHKEEKGGVILKEGEEFRFEEIGRSLGAALSNQKTEYEPIII
jgi:flavodoxin